MAGQLLRDLGGEADCDVADALQSPLLRVLDTANRLLDLTLGRRRGLPCLLGQGRGVPLVRLRQQLTRLAAGLSHRRIILLFRLGGLSPQSLGRGDVPTDLPGAFVDDRADTRDADETQEDE